MPPPEVLAQQKFMEACALLKDDKMRTFRIDIETDSTIEVDRQQAKEAVVEMFTAMGGFLEKAALLAQGMPELAPALGQSFLFGFRTFGAGRDVESYWEQAIDKLTQKAKNPQPKPPSPEQIKAQAEQAKAQREQEQAQQQAVLDKQKADYEFMLQQQKDRMELEKERLELQFDRERLQMERERIGMKLQGEQQKAVIQGEAAMRDAAIADRQAARDEELSESKAEREAEMMDKTAEAREHEHGLNMEVAEFKAKEAKKPKAGEAK